MDSQEIAQAQTRMSTIQTLLGEIARQRSEPGRGVFESAADFLGRFTYQATCAMRTVTDRDERIARLAAELSAMTLDRKLWKDRYDQLNNDTRLPARKRRGS